VLYIRIHDSKSDISEIARDLGEKDSVIVIPDLSVQPTPFYSDAPYMFQQRRKSKHLLDSSVTGLHRYVTYERDKILNTVEILSDFKRDQSQSGW